MADSTYNPPVKVISLLPEPGSSPERYSLAVITDDADIFPEIRKNMGGEFRTSLATTKDEVRP